MDELSKNINLFKSNDTGFPDSSLVCSTYLNNIDYSQCDFTCREHCRELLKKNGNTNPSDEEINECVVLNCTGIQLRS